MCRRRDGADVGVAHIGAEIASVYHIVGVVGLSYLRYWHPEDTGGDDDDSMLPSSLVVLY